MEIRTRSLTPECLALGAVLILAAALRFFHLDYQSFWFDEALSTRLAAHDTLRALLTALRGDVHPPLYFLLLHYWIRWCGDSDVALRSLSVLFGLLTIVPLYALARMIMSRGPALLGCVLFACSSFQVWYAQEARMYSLLGLLSVCATLALLKLLLQSRWVWALIYGAAAAALLYTQYMGALLLAAHGVTALAYLAAHTHVQPAKLLLRGCGACVFALLLLLPWLDTFCVHLHRVSADFWAARPAAADFFALYFKFFAYEALARHGIAAVLGAILLAAAASAGVTLVRRAQGNASMRWGGVVLLLSLLLPPLAGWLISHGSSSIWIARAFSPSAFSMYLLAAYAALSLPLPAARRAAAAALVLLCTLFYPAMYFRPAKEQWRRAAHIVALYARTGDEAVFDDPGVEIAFRRYYRAGAPLPTRTYATAGARRVWVIRALSRRPKREIVDILRGRGYTLWQEKRALAISLFMFGKSESLERAPHIGD